MSTTPIASMTRQALRSEITRLSEIDNITPADNRRLTQMLAEYEHREAQLARLATATRSPGHDEGIPSPTMIVRKSRNEVFTAEARSRTEAADLAQRAIDIVEADGGREVKPEVRRLVGNNPDFAEQFRATADPAYLSAFAKLILAGDAGRSMLVMSDEERSAMQRVHYTEARAMATTPDTAGGYALPQLLDPMVTITNTGSVGRVRDLARVVTGVGSEWQGINSAGITASWDAEGVEVSDDSPLLQSNSITAHKAAAFVPFSLEIEADWADMVEQMRRLLADSKDRLENTAFISGDGSGKPYGLIHRLTASTTVEIETVTSGVLGSVDVYALLAALPPRYRSNASWMMSLDVMNEVRAVGDDKLGNFVTDLAGGYGFSLLGRPVYESSDMDSMPTGTAAANLTVVGDFSQYVVFDRLASARVELVNHLFSTANGRPTGQRALYYYWRTGADLVSGAASTEPGFRLLVNKTS